MEEQIKILAKGLVENGLKYAFGVTGSGYSLMLITELENLGVQYYPVAHEASAAIMAGTVSNITGNISVSISIKGPGFANMLPGIVYNHFENNPALSISEAFGSETPVYRKHKRLDHVGIFSRVVKKFSFSNQVERELPILLDAAREEVPGPVHLELCEQHLKENGNYSFKSDNLPLLKQVTPEEVVRRLHKSERPILVIGSLVCRRNWKEKLQFLSIPIFTTASAKGVLDESLMQSAGVYSGEGKELAPEAHLFAEADLIVGIGLRNTEVLSPKPFGKPTIIVDEINEGLTDGFDADVMLTDASSKSVYDILDTLSQKSWGGERTDFLRRNMENTLLKGLWLPSVCFRVLNDLDFPYTLVLDTGAFCTIGEHLWKAGPSRFFLGSSNGRYMGVALPSAVGAAICRKELPVFCVVGDGGMRMYPAEIKIAIEESLPMCFILMTDGRYGSIVGVPQKSFRSIRATTVLLPSWWKAVEGMGCESYTVNSVKAFEAALQGWNRSAPLFIEINFDPTEYAEMTRQLR